MPDDRYPLKAVREVRGRAQTAAERALAEAIRAHEAAREKADHAARALSDLRREEKARRASERERLRSCTAAELHRAEAYAARQRAREATLALDVARARHEARAAKTALEQARRRLGQRSAEREVVDRHERRWRAEGARADERREADELDEIAARKNRT